MDNPGTLATLCTQDAGLRQTQHKNITQKSKKVHNTVHTKTRGSIQVLALHFIYIN